MPARSSTYHKQVLLFSYAAQKHHAEHPQYAVPSSTDSTALLGIQFPAQYDSLSYYDQRRAPRFSQVIQNVVPSTLHQPRP